jgi:protein ImuB
MPMPSRLACILVPLFPLAARLRSEPELSGEALAILSGSGGGARIVVASRAARKAGVRAGFTLAQARAVLPRVVARACDPECERSAGEALFEAAESISPRVESAGGGMAFLDIDGMDRCFPSERSLAQSLIAAAQAAGLPARAGVAGSKLSARVAAELPDSPIVVPRGKESDFLAPLSLTRLSPEPEIAERLRRWGLKKIGDLARLPEGEVVARLGEAGRRLHSSARGIDPSPLLPRTPPPLFAEGMDLEWPLASIEPFLFVARSALDRLVGRLASQALACIRLELTLTLDPDGVDARAVDLPAPTRESKTLLTLVRLNLEARPPGAPLSGFRFVAHPDRPRRAQLSLFGPAALSPDDLAACLARLAAQAAPGQVGRPAAVDGHRPERFSVEPYAPAVPPDFPASPRSGRGLLAVRVLRPAIALEVETQEGRLTRILTPGPSRGRVLRTGPERPRASNRGEASPRLPSPDAGEGGPKGPGEAGVERGGVSRGEEQTKGRLEIRGEIRVASGPWRMEEAWWSESAADRDYWDVELSGGGLYRIFEDRKSGAWFADGIYD